jgi:hypothetical protein
MQMDSRGDQLIDDDLANLSPEKNQRERESHGFCLGSMDRPSVTYNESSHSTTRATNATITIL